MKAKFISAQLGSDLEHFCICLREMANLNQRYGFVAYVKDKEGALKYFDSIPNIRLEYDYSNRYLGVDLVRSEEAVNKFYLNPTIFNKEFLDPRYLRCEFDKWALTRNRFHYFTQGVYSKGMSGFFWGGNEGLVNKFCDRFILDVNDNYPNKDDYEWDEIALKATNYFDKSEKAEFKYDRLQRFDGAQYSDLVFFGDLFGKNFFDDFRNPIKGELYV